MYSAKSDQIMIDYYSIIVTAIASLGMLVEDWRTFAPSIEEENDISRDWVVIPLGRAAASRGVACSDAEVPVANRSSRGRDKT